MLVIHEIIWLCEIRKERELRTEVNKKDKILTKPLRQLTWDFLVIICMLCVVWLFVLDELNKLVIALIIYIHWNQRVMNFGETISISGGKL